MKKLFLLTSIVVFFLSDPAYAQWQLIVSPKPDHEITPVDPSDPDNGTVVREKIVLISVADENGATSRTLRIPHFDVGLWVSKDAQAS